MDWIPLLPTRTPLLLLGVWACFLVRGAFYSAAFPIWEGFDEWAHFAVIQRMVERDQALVWRHSPISREIAASLEVVPVPWELRYLAPPSITEDAYWRMPANERASREKRFFAMPASWAAEDAKSGLTAYEALQPPVYYWISSQVLRVIRGFDLGSRVLLLRWFSVALGSLVIPLCFLIGRVLFANDSLGIACATAITAMPEFLIDIARVGNECAGVVCWSLFIWLLVISVQRGLTRGRAISIGVVLGVGLLTKAYFLAAIPVVALLLIFDLWTARARIRPAVMQALTIVALAFAISGWWYIRNVVETGTLSGLSEAEMLAGKVTIPGLIARVGQINWPSAVDAILFSHVWFGGWSSLTIRSWMYHVFYLLIALAAFGIAQQRRHPIIVVLTGVYVSFWLGQLYNVLLLYAAKGIATSMGWYMYAVVCAEVALAIAGLRPLLPARLRRYVPLIGVSLFVLLDLYTIHAVALPYYAGLIAHRSNGTIAHLHPADLSQVGFGEIFTRLTVYKTGTLSQGALLALWGVYLIASGVLVAIGMRCGADNETPQPVAPRVATETSDSCPT